MGCFLDCASGASIWRGYDYFEQKKVISIEAIGENIFSAKVSGNSNEPYSVELQLSHPRKSTCNCPHANGRSIVCKHMIAVYFVLRPLAAETYRQKMIEQQEYNGRYDEEYEYYAQLDDEFSEKVSDYVRKMKKSDLQQALLQVLFDGPDWQYNRFIEEHGLYD